MEYAQSADGLYCMLGMLGAYKNEKNIFYINFAFSLNLYFSTIFIKIKTEEIYILHIYINYVFFLSFRNSLHVDNRK